MAGRGNSLVDPFPYSFLPVFCSGAYGDSATGPSYLLSTGNRTWTSYRFQLWIAIPQTLRIAGGNRVYTTPHLGIVNRLPNALTTAICIWDCRYNRAGDIVARVDYWDHAARNRVAGFTPLYLASTHRVLFSLFRTLPSCWCGQCNARWFDFSLTTSFDSTRWLCPFDIHWDGRCACGTCRSDWLNRGWWCFMRKRRYMVLTVCEAHLPRFPLTAEELDLDRGSSHSSFHSDDSDSMFAELL